MKAIIHNNNHDTSPADRHVTKRERKILESANMVLNYETIIKECFIDALEQSTTGKIERTNLISKMAIRIKRTLTGKVSGFTRFTFANHMPDVAWQTYIFNKNSANPLIAEYSEYRSDGRPITYLQPLFSIEDEVARNNNGNVPSFAKSRGTSYRNAQSMGINWKLYCDHMIRQSVTIIELGKEEYLEMFRSTGEYDNSKDGEEYSGKESLAMKEIRAERAVDYIIEHVVGKELVLSPVPDSRSRVAKYRLYFADGEEVNPQHAWFINYFSESWRTNLYELWVKEELTADGLESLKVSAARAWYKDNTSKRISWRKAKAMFKNSSEAILTHCKEDRDHGMYYPRMAELIEAGVGTLTGFMLEADLAASGIGSAALNIHSLPMAKATSVAGAATPADAHRELVEEIMKKVISDEDVIEHWIAKDYKKLKKMNVEVTHAQSIKVTTAKWNAKLSGEYGLTIPELTEEDLSEVYNRIMPGMLQWIAAITSITIAGVTKGYDVLTWRAPDGVKCSTSAYTKSRKFSAVAVDKNDKTVRLALQMDMPIEVGMNGSIAYEGPDDNGEAVKYQNKTMGAWANLIQADDAWIKRTIVKYCSSSHNFVPIVKHDGYYTHANNTKNMIAVAYEVREQQFKLQPIKSGFEQMAEFLKIYKIELPSGSMTLKDFRCAIPSESPLMYT